MTVREQSPRESRVSRLARQGFTQPARAEKSLDDPVLGVGAGAAWLEDALAETADPDEALAGLLRLASAGQADLVEALRQDPALRARLLGVLAVSPALGDHLSRHPDDWRTLVGDRLMPAVTADEMQRTMLAAVGVDADGPRPHSAPDGGSGALDALRVGYRGCLLRLAARDVVEGAPVEEVAAGLADLAAATLEAALAVARATLPEDVEPARLAVVGMGKCGGRELNYASDVDVIFVAEALPGGDEQAALETATNLAVGLVRACSLGTDEGAIWPVDTALRPEGKSGSLVRTLASHVAYYERWAKTWEFQALLKARPVAGDLELGQRYVDAVAPLVWSAAARDGFVEDVQSMRRRVVEHIPQRDAGRQLKLGPGGLRDVEFAVQLLQLVHGRVDETLRTGGTLSALSALSAGGYVAREDAGRLGDAYRFLRSVEHRLQLHRLARTHVLPDDEADLRRIGRSLGFRSDPVAELDGAWRRHGREVRRLHEKLFYRPLLSAVARLAPGEARLTPEAARTRLEALGYADPVGALRHLEALTGGVSRRAAIQRTLLPVMLGWFADAPVPDAGLLAFRKVSDALGSTHWYLRLLRDEGAAAERMARLLSSSRLAVDLLLRSPDAVAMLGSDEELLPRSSEPLRQEAAAAVRRAPDAETASGAVRAIRRRELFRVAAADVLGRIEVREVGEALSSVTVATLSAGLEAACRQVAARYDDHRLPVRVATVAMGRLGGHEQGYASDADVIFVHEAEPGVSDADAADAAIAVATELRRLLMVPAPDPPLVVDSDLRPEGRQGPLVRSLDAYASYYARWSSPWERQALLRAEPVAGDPGLCARFLAVIDPVRWPEGGVDETAVREIRRIKARVEAERLPRGADPTLHTKLGRGGLADVEWTVQLLQLRHAGRVPSLRTTRTLDALAAAAAAGLLADGDARVLAEAWTTATRVRNAVALARGAAADSLPTAAHELASVAHLLGYAEGGGGALVDDYRRVTRRARAVVEAVFYA